MILFSPMMRIFDSCRRRRRRRRRPDDLTPSLGICVMSNDEDHFSRFFSKEGGTEKGQDRLFNK
jgi:hypothetical protein